MANKNLNNALIKVNNLTIKIDKTTILSDINLSISKNQLVTLIGPNGAGKSTLIKAILGLIPIETGSVIKAKNMNIGYMPQKVYIQSLMPLTVINFLKLAKNIPKIGYDKILEEVKITHLKNSKIQEISGGEFQRVLLARALSQEPDLLVLDEPVQGVDITGQLELYSLILDIKNNRGCGVLLVSHDLNVVMKGTDKVVCLNKHICCEGLPENISIHPEFVKLFGEEISKQLAIYSHTHNHEHDLTGNIKDD